jgi:hypothetical protein
MKILNHHFLKTKLSASAALKLFQKKKGKKRKRFQRGCISFSKLFDLKIFLLKE